mgnify:CR=1 FL=1
MRGLAFAAILISMGAWAMRADAQSSPPDRRCGEIVTIDTHRNTKTRYAIAQPKTPSPTGERVALVLLLSLIHI